MKSSIVFVTYLVLVVAGCLLIITTGLMHR